MWKAEKLKQFIEIDVKWTDEVPGSSVPSTQSQKSSLRRSLVKDFEPSLHLINREEKYFSSVKVRNRAQFPKRLKTLDEINNNVQIDDLGLIHRTANTKIKTGRHLRDEHRGEVILNGRRRQGNRRRRGRQWNGWDCNGSSPWMLRICLSVSEVRTHNLGSVLWFRGKGWLGLDLTQVNL